MEDANHDKVTFRSSLGDLADKITASNYSLAGAHYVFTVNLSDPASASPSRTRP